MLEHLVGLKQKLGLDLYLVDLVSYYLVLYHLALYHHLLYQVDLGIASQVGPLLG